MKTIRIIPILLAVFIIASSAQAFSQNNDEESFKSMSIQILKLVNAYRRSNGLGELQMNEAINAEAIKHSMNMAKGVVPFSHDGFDGRADRLMAKLGGNSIAENVANGQTDAESAVESWLGSTGHRENIEGNYNLTGIGIARGKDGDLYFTQIFILVKSLKK